VRLSTANTILRNKLNHGAGNSCINIAVSLVLGKFFNCILLKWFSKYLAASSAQTGSSADQPMNICILSLEEVVLCHVISKSSVYSVLPDTFKTS
jgi:hypothetical protein